MARDVFKVGDLTAVIGDNEGYDGHRAGYNGVHRLTHRTNPKSLFTVTGLNHEHIFDGDHELRGDNKVFFEPRNAPMTFRRISESEAPTADADLLPGELDAIQAGRSALHRL